MTKIPTLDDFRSEIDIIDNKIINLLKSRMAVVAKVAEFKRKNNYKFFIRSAREADMIKDLQKKCDFSFPKSAIFDIWRKIISSSNFFEQKLKITIHNPKNIPDYFYLVRQYYGDFFPINSKKSAKNIISEINKNQIQIGVFALKQETNNQSWWEIISNSKSEVKIFALIAKANSKEKTTHAQNDLFLVASKEAEKSKQDNSLLTLKISKDISQNKILSILKKARLSAKILDSKDLIYLIEIKGFYTNSSQEILALKGNFDPKAKIKIIGNYPVFN
jgi:chorismate mutase